MCSNTERVGSVRRPLQLPSNPEAWDGVDRADLVDECKGCGLSKGPLVDPLVLADDTQNPEVAEAEEPIIPASSCGDPWAHLNGLPLRCTCDS